jgi:lycopene cyclase domain-containing protein
VTYTQAALLAVGATVLLDLVVLRTRLLTRKAFWTAYAIIVFFQLLTNGILTGRGIVVYDGDAITGSTSGRARRRRCSATGASSSHRWRTCCSASRWWCRRWCGGSGGGAGSAPDEAGAPSARPP